MDSQIVVCRKCGNINILTKIEYKTTKQRKCKTCPKCGNSHSKYLRIVNQAKKYLDDFGPYQFKDEIEFQKALIETPGFTFITNNKFEGDD